MGRSPDASRCFGTRGEEDGEDGVRWSPTTVKDQEEWVGLAGRRLGTRGGEKRVGPEPHLSHQCCDPVLGGVTIGAARCWCFRFLGNLSVGGSTFIHPISRMGHSVGLGSGIPGQIHRQRTEATVQTSALLCGYSFHELSQNSVRHWAAGGCQMCRK